MVVVHRIAGRVAQVHVVAEFARRPMLPVLVDSAAVIVTSPFSVAGAVHAFLHLLGVVLVVRKPRAALIPHAHRQLYGAAEVSEKVAHKEDEGDDGAYLCAVVLGEEVPLGGIVLDRRSRRAADDHTSADECHDGSDDPKDRAGDRAPPIHGVHEAEEVEDVEDAEHHERDAHALGPVHLGHQIRVVAHGDGPGVPRGG